MRSIWLTWQKGKGSGIDTCIIQCVTDMNYNVFRQGDARFFLFTFS